MKLHKINFFKASAVVAFGLLICNMVLKGQQPTHEYQLKAAFLYNFTQFVEWPEGSFSKNEAPWVIGILGENPFNTYLEEIVSGEKINGHPVIINYYKNTDEIKTCHILFINLADSKQQELALAGLERRNILTVSDAPYFPQNGGMIRLFTRDNKIKIQVNLEASKAANLVISSKLLKLAEIFTPKKNS